MAADTARVQSLRAQVERLTRLKERRSTVLVVDDMQSMRLLLAQALRAQGFSQVLRAADGEQAWGLLEAQTCDLALVDWNMPRVDGLTLLDQVREHPLHRDMVFILVTAESQDVKVMQAAEERQDAYLTKPVSADKLSRRLELVLSRRLTLAQAELLEAQGQPEQALELLLGFSSQQPRLLWPYFGLAALLARQGRDGEAQRCYQRVLELEPRAGGALLGLGRLLEGQGQPRQARAVFRQALKQSPGYHRASDALADSLLAEGRREEAAQALLQAVAQEGGHSAARQERLGRLCLELGRLEEARDALGQAWRLKPGRLDGQSALLLGQTCLRLGQAGQALEPLAAAARILEGQPGGQAEARQAAQLLGQAHLALGQTGQARAAWSRLRDDQSRGVPALELERDLALLCLEIGQQGEALAHLAAGLNLALADPAGREDLEKLCLKAGGPSLLERARQMAAAQREDEAQAACQRGLELVAQGRWDQARGEYRRGLELDPHSARLRFNLGKLLWRMAQPAEALKEAARAAQLGLAQADWELIAELGRLLAALGRLEEARRLLQAGLEQAPGEECLAQALTAVELAALAPDPAAGPPA